MGGGTSPLTARKVGPALRARRSAPDPPLPAALGSSINHTADKSVTLGFQKDDAAPDIYPSPGRWILGQRVLSRRPEIGRILQHPAMTSAVEQAIGARGVISQFVAYDRTPGAMGTGGLPDQQPGIGAHCTCSSPLDALSKPKEAGCAYR